MKAIPFHGKRYHYEINSTLKRKSRGCAACLKYSVPIFVE
jgi:hypothetical protein